MNGLEEQGIIKNLVNQLKVKADKLIDEKIKTQFLENLKFHEELSEHLYKCIHFVAPFIKISDESPIKNNNHRLKIESRRLNKSKNELEKIENENTLVLEKANIILDILITCQKHNSAGLEEGFKGGHFKINDNGELYANLEKSGLTRERISSHYGACKENGAVDGKSDRSLTAGKMFSEFLFGFTNNPPATWFQLEAAPLTREKFIETRVQKILNDILETLTAIVTLGYTSINLNTIQHGLDWVNYAIVNGKQKNIGQYGASEHTEKKTPLIIESEIKVTIPENKVSDRVNNKEITSLSPRL
ncbi:hypothetical protein I862_03760 [endosymbiont of Acanthamoeba sp. UWC8]|uniref:hypothetical protein n=1 Tax=endosymbiont of Acanthamoeba sp. UWC8 TaxID=86106 RepID=UPI0004D164E5|nr:hypothetical protein [endosymbiont of Acanthamoeba sp. UWC8]AIF81312.1 hypothetical protein I862_03760 [endosymbiont of Acanthamoeba sp. UWC8]